MPITQAHDRYMRILFERIQESRYPSGEHVDQYLDILFEKVEEDRYPSKQLLDRIARWTLSAS